MDRLQAMTTFVAVVNCGSFASAARKLNMSPSLVTRAVADLETRLGLPLLNRTTRVVRVTDVGAQYADDCRRILAEIEDADAAASRAHSSPHGTLTITAPVLFGQIYVTPLLGRYLAKCPEVSVQCLFLDRIMSLLEEGIDVALRIGELPSSSLHATRVGTVRQVLVASPGYLRARSIPKRPQDLREHTTIVAAGVTPSSDWLFDVDREPLVQRVQPRLTMTTNESAIGAALAGLGIARLLSYQVASHIKQGSLKLLLEPFEPAPLPVHVVYPGGRRVGQKVRAFIELAVDALRADRTLN